MTKTNVSDGSHYDEGMRLLRTADFHSVHDCIAWLQREESAA